MGASTTARATSRTASPFNGNYPNGVETLISKNSNGPRFTIVPNGLGQAHIGVKGVEPIASDWSLVFKFENGFDPYTLQRANGPKSLVENNTTPLDAQTANGDSSRAGQLFNTESYVGFSHPTYGELTAGRQNSLITDGLGRADPMGAAPNFSVIGVSNTAAGAGDTFVKRYGCTFGSPSASRICSRSAGSSCPTRLRRWVNHFGPMIAADLRSRRPKPCTTWHLDEVYLKIDGRMVYRWRAVDVEGEVLDVPVQSKRNVLNNSEAVKGLAHMRFSTAPLDRRMRTSKRNCSSSFGASRVLSATPRRILPRAEQMASL